LTVIDPRAAQKIQPELLSGETIYWAGMPNPRVIFHSDDWVTIPFFLLWGGFFIFWEASVLGYWGGSPKHGPYNIFLALWGVPFILVGQYFIWGRFLHDAWLKRRTYYAVTNRRVIAIQDGRNRKTSVNFLDHIPSIEREAGSNGTLWFGPKLPLIGSRRSAKRSVSRFDLGPITVFADIADVDDVYRLVMDLQAKKNTSSQPAFT
jgi:hypothetical protein